MRNESGHKCYIKSQGKRKRERERERERERRRRRKEDGRKE